MRPVICMITAAVTGAGEQDALVRRIEAAARAGVHLVQIRQPGLEGLALMRIVERAVRATEGSAARILVNERLDVALAAGADGLHLRGESMSAARVREVVPKGFVIGRSVHSVADAMAAEQSGGLDYVLFGTVFATPSKPQVTPAGLDALATACRAVALPVLAIGGMRISSLSAVARTGAAGFAAIDLFASAGIDALPRVIERACAAFDTSGGVP